MVKAQPWLFMGLLIAVPFFSFAFVHIGGVPVGRPDIVMALLLVTAFALSVLVEQRRLIVNRTALWVIWLNAATLLSIVNGLFRPSFSLAEFVTVAGQLVLGSMVFVAVANFKVDRQRLTLILQVWLLVAGAIGAYAIYQAFARNLGLPFGYLELSNQSYVSITAAGRFGDFVRPSSVFFEPSRLGVYLIAPTILVTFSMAGPRMSSLIFKSRAIHFVLLMSIVGGFMLSFAMSGYISLAVAGLVMIVSARRLVGFNQLVLIGLGTASVLVLLVVAISISNIDFLSAFERVGRVFSDPTSDGSTIERAARVIVGFRIWLDYPIIGVGANQIQFVSGNYTFPSWYSDNYGNAAFAASGVLWITLLAQTGIFGFFALAFVFSSSIGYLRRIMRSCDDLYGRTLAHVFFLMIWSIMASISLTYVELILWVQLAIIHMFINNVRRFGLFQGEHAESRLVSA